MLQLRYLIAQLLSVDNEGRNENEEKNDAEDSDEEEEEEEIEDNEEEEDASDDALYPVSFCLLIWTKSPFLYFHVYLSRFPCSQAAEEGDISLQPHCILGSCLFDCGNHSCEFKLISGT